MSNDAREIETKHIIENFHKIFDTSSHAINVSYHDDETIHVFVRRDDEHAEFVMDVGSDDDVYHFVDVDHNFPDVIFDTGY